MPEDRIEYAVIGTNAVNVLMTLVAVGIHSVYSNIQLITNQCLGKFDV